MPALIVVAGMGLSELTGAIDRALGVGSRLPALSMSSNAATWLLSTVAGATITTAGVVFSLTVVSLQLASSQFSPRVMRSFIRDRLSQVVIGLLVATFVFCVLTLRRISPDVATPAPPVSLTVASALTVGTVLLIVAHVDRLARHLQVGEVVRVIAREGAETVTRVTATSRHERESDARTPPPGAASLVVPAPRDGWVTQHLGIDMLDAVGPGTVVRLETRTGAYIHQGEPLVTLWPPPKTPSRVARRLTRAIEVAPMRTMQQDVDFALRQLVDVALRAASPAVNDPTTIVEVTLRIGSLLRKLLLSELPPLAVERPDGRVLLRPWKLSHDEYIAHAFDQIRRDGCRDPLVAATILRVLRMLIKHVEDNHRPEHVPALEQQIRWLLDDLARDPALHPDERARLESIGESPDDPADHGTRSD